jgi:CBS domain-containing protein
LIVKAVIWSVALGSGTSGGVLAPLLIMGGVLGSLFGSAVSPGDTGLWALVGMASMMGGTMRAPLTSMMFGLELTHDLNALLPLAIGCAAAHTTTVLLLKRSILTEKVARRGHHITREYVIDPFETIRVADIMARPAESLPAHWTVAETLSFFTAPDAPRRHKSYPVIDAHNKVIGMVSRTDALRWLGNEDGERLLREQVAGQELVVGYDDELAGHLADRMSFTDHGRVPVLSRATGALVGLVARRDLLRVRTNMMRHEREREALIRVLPRRA